ncbi:MAG: hypothetical protein M3R14_01915 [Acidobacteriota bacterium]|nr:hypothetical protein [Acidobacteriota bacterium]
MPVNNVAAPPAQSTEDVLSQQRAMQQEGFAQSMAMLTLQREQNQKSEAIAALSNTMKNAHDSNMLVINNAKG